MSGLKKIKVLIVDDHAALREPLALALSAEPDIEAATAPEAERAVALAAADPFDVVLMDIDMPGLDCFAAARRIAEARPAAKIIFLSAFAHDSYIESALAAGAKGFLSKSEAPAAIGEAIRSVAGGGASFSEAIMKRLVIGPGSIQLAADGATRASTLTTREREILGYLAKGLSKKEIAGSLGLSVKTIDAHAVSIMGKLGIHDRVELARYAIREKLVEP